MRHLPALACCLLLGVARADGPTPDDSLAALRATDGLVVSLVAAEPLVRQPVAIEFDDRGRLWVIQYLQYPNPAGLERVAVDRYSRTRYDRVPEPPPHGPRGADRITILHDTDGDGRMDAGRDFVAGLNLASGLAFGHDGVFVLNVPYLLFYPDRDRDDVPDGDPEVLLEGFGMEDAHSVANSLVFGPDGWLYGCQGSTVTSRIRGIEFQQGVWRYHPLTRAFELFCEGGGNAWGLDFDRTGQALVSTNVGGHVLLHAIQGGLCWKSFGKHGPLHNPHAYGWFDHAPHAAFHGGHVTVGGLLYQDDLFPAEFRDCFIAGDLLGHGVRRHRLEPWGSTVRTHDAGSLLESTDAWFAPTDLTVGPDGAIYIADWTDARTAHPDPDAEWDRSNGRIYRLAPRDGPRATAVEDPATLDVPTLVAALDHPGQWHVRRARRELARRAATDDAAVLAHRPALAATARTAAAEKAALESLWTLHTIGGLDDTTALSLLDSPHAAIREWTVRLLGDRGDVGDTIAHRLDALAETEPDAGVRRQLASTAARLPARHALPVINAAINRDDDGGDPRIPLLLWWAVERHAITGRDEVLRRFVRPTLWQSAVGRELLLPRLVRRYAADDTPAAQDALADLLRAAADDGRRRPLWAAVVAGCGERPVDDEAWLARVGDHEIVRWLHDDWSRSPDEPTLLEAGVVLDLDEPVARAIAIAADPKAAAERRAGMLRLLAPRHGPALVPLGRRLAEHETDTAVRVAAIDLLGDSDDADARDTLLALASNASADVAAASRRVLLGRPESARAWLEAVDRGAIPASSASLEEVRRVAVHGDPALDAIVTRHWGRLEPVPRGERLAEVRRLGNDLRAAAGDPAAGQVLFTRHCAGCHRLFGAGAAVGPDLTSANRRDREFMLLSLVDPDSTIRRDYTSLILRTRSGRVFTGLPVARDEGSITLVDPTGRREVVPRADVEEIHESPRSLMPDDLSRLFTPQALRDLFAFLEADAPPPRTYVNSLRRIDDPAPILGDHPDFFAPIREEARFEAPPLVVDDSADLHVRAWRFSYNARGIVEMDNHLRARDTAVIVVHPWAIDDDWGWRTPEPAGVADFCTPRKNAVAAGHTSRVIVPFLDRLRGRTAGVMYSLPGPADPLRTRLYRTFAGSPPADVRRAAAEELRATLAAFDYSGEPVPASFPLTHDAPVRDYFRHFPGLDAGPRFNGAGFWSLPIPVSAMIPVADDDVVIFDDEGYPALRDFLRRQGVRHVLLTGYATDMCYCRTTAGYENLDDDFNVFLVADASLATFPANDTPRYAVNAAISIASLEHLVTQVSWVTIDPETP